MENLILFVAMICFFAGGYHFRKKATKYKKEQMKSKKIDFYDLNHFTKKEKK